MMLWNLINMSDDVTFEAPDYATSAAVTILLGSGQYGARSHDGGEQEVPMLMFGAASAFMTNTFGDLTTWLDANREKLADALASVYYGSPEEIDEIRSLSPEALKAQNEERRTSLNNIVGRAHQAAASLRKGSDEIQRAPQQVFSL